MQPKMQLYVTSLHHRKQEVGRGHVVVQLIGPTSAPEIDVTKPFSQLTQRRPLAAPIHTYNTHIIIFHNVPHHQSPHLQPSHKPLPRPHLLPNQHCPHLQHQKARLLRRPSRNEQRPHTNPKSRSQSRRASPKSAEESRSLFGSDGRDESGYYE